MSGYFTAAQQAEAAGEVVHVARLVEAEFASETSRMWEGAGLLVTEDGKTWKGGGEMLSIGDLHAITNGSAVTTEFALSGVPVEFVRAARQSETEAKNRPIRVYGQFLTDRGKPLGLPWVITTMRMDLVKYTMEGAGQRGVALTAESLLAGRKRPPYGRLTDADQQARHPGDKGLELMGALVDKTVTWPDF